MNRNLEGTPKHLWKALISSWSVYKRDRHRQFLYLVCWFLKKKPSPLKPHGQIKRNFTGSIYGRFSIIYPHFISIGQKHGRHGQFLFEISRLFRISYFSTIAYLGSWKKMNYLFTKIWRKSYRVIVLLALLTKGHLSFCNHLVSVVRLSYVVNY